MRRVHHGNTVWHVFARGARRLNLFHQEEDFITFQSILRRALAGSGLELYAWVLMSNHFHLAIRADWETLAAFMKRIDQAYSVYHNKKYKLSGHAFDGPYQAYAQGTLGQAVATIAYVFLNPVTAGLCEHPAQYRWSGFGAYVGRGPGPVPVAADRILSRLDPNPAAARRKFFQMLEWKQALLRRRGTVAASRAEILVHQFESLLDAAERSGGAAGLGAEEVAVYWGDQVGTPLKVLMAVLGKGESSIRRLRREVQHRIQADPTLADRLALP